MIKKVMLILNEAPLPYAGAASRWYYILCKELQHRDIDLDLFVACSKEEQLGRVRELFPGANVFLYVRDSGFLNKIKTLIRPFSYTISKEMELAIQSKKYDSYDIVHVEQTFATWALPYIDKKCMLSVHYLANIDLKNTKSKTFKDYLILPLLKRTEKKLIDKYQFIKTCSPEIEKEIVRWYPSKKTKSFPFAIDVENYRFLPSEERRRTNTITLIASMNWYPGKSAALNLINEIWPSLKKLNPSMKLRIVGWEARSVLKDYLQLSDVEILENVPEIKKYFYESDVFVYTPDQGSGIKIKIQEAMLLGTPIVTNANGVEGLTLSTENEVLISNNHEETIRLIHQLFNDINLQERLRLNARRVIENTCNGKVVVDELLEFYRKIKEEA